MDIFNTDSAPELEKTTSPITEHLINDLQRAVQLDPLDDLDTALKNQALLLDKAFRRLLSNADILHQDEAYSKTEEYFHCAGQYTLAFQAQQQSQATAKALGALKYMRALSAPQEAPLPPMAQICKQTEGL